MMTFLRIIGYIGVRVCDALRWGNIEISSKAVWAGERMFVVKAVVVVVVACLIDC